MLLTSMMVPMQVCVTTLHFCDMYDRHPLSAVRKTAHESLCVITYSAFHSVLQTYHMSAYSSYSNMFLSQ